MGGWLSAEIIVRNLNDGKVAPCMLIYRYTGVPYLSSLSTLPPVVVTVGIVAVVQRSGSSSDGEVFNPVQCLSLKTCIKYTTSTTIFL